MQVESWNSWIMIIRSEWSSIAYFVLTRQSYIAKKEIETRLLQWCSKHHPWLEQSPLTSRNIFCVTKIPLKMNPIGDSILINPARRNSLLTMDINQYHDWTRFDWHGILGMVSIATIPCQWICINYYHHTNCHHSIDSISISVVCTMILSVFIILIAIAITIVSTANISTTIMFWYNIIQYLVLWFRLLPLSDTIHNRIAIQHFNSRHVSGALSHDPKHLKSTNTHHRP